MFAINSNKSKPLLPEEILDYRLIEVKKNRLDTDTNSLGVYENRIGHKAFGKIIAFNYHNTEYFRLKNEINFYNVYASHAKSKNFNKKNLNVPKLIYFKESKNSLFVLLEYISGTSAKDLVNFDNVAEYIKNIDLLVSFGKKFTKKEKSLFSSRNMRSYLMLYPGLFLSSYSKYPKARIDLLRGLVLLIRNFNFILKPSNLVLSHRDLHLGNIIFCKKNTYLIDFELVGYSLPLYDYLVALKQEWSNVKFRKKLIKSLEQQNNKNVNFEDNIRTLGIFIATHGLTDANSSANEKSNIHEFLKFFLNYKVHKD